LTHMITSTKTYQIVLTSWSQSLIASIVEQRGSNMSQMVFVVGQSKLNWHTQNHL
jgi:hypothetical protein